MTSTNLQKEIVESGRVSPPLRSSPCTDVKYTQFPTICRNNCRISHNLQKHQLNFSLSPVSGTFAALLAGEGLLSPVLFADLAVSFTKLCPSKDDGPDVS